MQSREQKILILAVTSHALVHIFDGMVAPLVPLLVEEFDTNYFRIGVIVSLFSVLFGLGSLPAGFLADRLGPRRLITIYLSGAGFAFGAVIFIGSYWTYAALMTMAGLFCSTYHPAANTLIGKEIVERGKAFGIHGIAGSLGTAAAPVIVAWMGSRAGWRAPHLVFGMVAVIAAVYSLSIPVHSNVREEDRPRVKLAVRSVPAASLIAFYIAAALLGLAYRANLTFLPAYLGERVQLGGIDAVTTGGIMATVTLLSGAVGQYMGGRLVDRHSPEILYLISIVVSAVFLLFMVWGNAPVLVVSAIVFALFHFATQPIQNDILARYVAQDRLGLAYGFHFLLVFGAGSFGGAGAGLIADRWGLGAVFLASALCFAVAAFTILYLVGRRHTHPLETGR